MVFDRLKALESETIKAFIFLFFVFLFGNILILDLLFIRGAIIEPRSDGDSKQISSQEQNQSLCPSSCIARIEEATASSDLIIEEESDEGSIQQKTSIQPRESLITLGTGSNASTEYTDVPTTQVYIDPAKYGTIQSVKFEVTIAVPTANQYVYVRLYNLTDKNPVWNSELYMAGGSGGFLESGPITLAKGNKLYVVQMKSQLKHLTNLNQARLRIESY